MTFGVRRPEIPEDVEFGPLNGVNAVDLVASAHDVNGDGLEDLFIAGGNFSPTNARALQTGVILLNDGQGGFTRARGDRPEGFGSSEVLVGDFNGDGVPDIFNADFGHDFPPFPGGPNQLLLGNGRGGFVDGSDGLPGLSDLSHSAAAGDIDGDGDLDIYVGNLAGPGDVMPYFLLNDGNANFTLDQTRVPVSIAPELVDSGTQPVQRMLSSELADVNGDGAVDLILGAEGGNGAGSEISRIFLNDGAGNFSDDRQIEIPGNPALGGIFELTLDSDVLDINEDGLQDIILLQTNIYDGYAIQFLIQTPEGGFVDEAADRIIGPAFGADQDNQYSRFLRIADVNEDGFDDIVLSDVHDVERPAFLLNTGFGSYVALNGTAYGSQNPMFEFGVNVPVLGGRNVRFADPFADGGPPTFPFVEQVGRPEFEGVFGRRADTVAGDRGADVIFAGGGADLVRGLGGNDSIHGEGGGDRLFGNGGRDAIAGGGGKDLVDGGGGKDFLDGGRGRDDIKGRGGSDTLEGGGGRDIIDAGGGRDVISGGRGRDDLTGGRGADVFQFQADSGSDRITDFAQGVDLIEIESGAGTFDELAITQSGSDVLIAFGAVLITVESQSAADFTAADFLF